MTGRSGSRYEPDANSNCRSITFKLGGRHEQLFIQDGTTQPALFDTPHDGGVELCTRCERHVSGTGLTRFTGRGRMHSGQRYNRHSGQSRVGSRSTSDYAGARPLCWPSVP